MKRFLIFITGFLFAINNSFADFPATMEVKNIKVNGGTVYVAVYFNETSYKHRKPEMSLKINPSNTTISQQISLPKGEFLIAVFQDSNENGKMDYNFIGMPKEPYGFSHMKGKIPGKFDEMKFIINNSNDKITIPLVEL